MPPLVEGRGYVEPGQTLVRLQSGDVQLLRSIADARDRFRRYASRSDQWGRGLIKHPILYGLMGEHALCVYLRRAGLREHVDDRLLVNGDKGVDLHARGLSMQVKTNLTGSANLIRRIDDHGNLLPLACDLFVFCRVSLAPLGVALKGWIWSRDAVGSNMNRIERSRVAKHWNLRIDPRQLMPMCRLVTELSARGVM